LGGFLRKITFVSLVFTAVLFVSTAVLADDDPFFPARPGMVLITADFNARGALVGYTRLFVKDVRVAGDSLEVIYVTDSLNTKMRPKAPPSEFRMVVVNGDVILDYAEYVGRMFRREGWPEGAFDIRVPGDWPRIAWNRVPGERLEDYDLLMAIDLDIFKFVTATSGVDSAQLEAVGFMVGGRGHIINSEIVLRVRDNMCLAVEDVTTPAGTFRAYKTTQRIEIETTVVVPEGSPLDFSDFAGGSTVTMVEWIVRGIGTVKSITYDADGEIKSTQELHEKIIP
jgi:hypothetical protein